MNVSAHGVDDLAGSSVTIGLRPERIHLGRNRPPRAEVAVPAEVVDSAFYGETIHYFLRLEARDEPIVASVTNFERADHFSVGDRVWAGFRGAAAVALPKE